MTVHEIKALSSSRRELQQYEETINKPACKDSSQQAELYLQQHQCVQLDLAASLTKETHVYTCATHSPRTLNIGA